MSKGFKRRQKVRRLKKTFLVVCEGSCEEIYIKGMKRWENLSNVNVIVLNPDVSSPVEVFNHARKEFRAKEYDAAFCVIDGDVIKKGTLPGEKFKSKGVEAVISRPCFELWLLLHYKYTDKEFYSCSELISKELKKYVPDYEKSRVYHSKKHFYGNLKISLDTAIRNAKRLEAENLINKKADGTSTGIYKLIERILHPI